MKVLIIGGYGFVGSVVAKTFYKEGHDLTIIDNLAKDNKESNADFKHKFYNMNETDPACESIFQSNAFDVVLYLSDVDKGSGKERYAVDSATDISGLVNILTLSQKYGVGKAVFASSAAVYGAGKSSLVKEDTACEPLSSYGIHKWIGELYCEKWNEIYNIDTLCFRLSNVYGPNQEQGKVIPVLINQLLNGKEVTVNGDGEQTSDFIYVEDAAEAIYQGVINGLSGVYNLSSNKEVSINRIVEILTEAGDLEKPAIIYGEPEEDIEYGRLDNSKLKDTLGWTPFHRLEEGLEKTFVWYKSQQNLKKAERSPAEFSLLGKPLQPSIPYLENAGLFIIAILLSSILTTSLYMVDYGLFYIVAVALLLGRKQAILSILLSSVWFFYGSIISGRELVSLLVDHNTLIHIGLYIFVGLTIGYVMEKKEREIADARSTAEQAKESSHALNTAYHETLEVNEELKNQVLYTNESFGMVSSIVKDLSHLDPFKVYMASISVVEQVMKSKEAALYIVDKSHQTLRLVAQSEGLKAQSILRIKNDPRLEDVRQTSRVNVNKELDPNQPSMISPIVIDDNFIGIVTVYNTSFEHLTLFNQNTMAVTTDLISASLGCAYQYQEVITDGKVSVRLPVYEKEEAYA